MTRIVGLVTCLALVGCGDLVVAASTDAESSGANELAHDFRSKVVAEDEGAAMLTQLSALPPEEGRAFFDAMIELQPAPTNEDERRLLEVARSMQARAQAEGRGTFIGTAKDEFEPEVIELIKANAVAEGMNFSPPGVSPSCFPKVACSVQNFDGKLWGASCGGGCIQAFGYDNVSNEACEWGACDTRLRFAASPPKSGIAGLTSQAQCVIKHYGNQLISQQAQSGQVTALVGILGPLACGIVTGVGDYLRQNIRLL